MWEPPAVPPPHADPTRVRGALGGALLYAQPRHAEVREGVLAHLAPPERRAFLEIGFDHGMKILDLARRHPESLWLGVELRRRRVDAAAPHAPTNCLLLRADARALLASVLPPGRLSGIYILFPTPSTNGRHLLLTPALVPLLGRALAPDGALYLATDVEPYFRWAEGIFSAWGSGGAVPGTPVLSRRERVCARDGLPVWRATWTPPKEDR